MEDVKLVPAALNDVPALAAMRRGLYAHDPEAIHEERDRETLERLIRLTEWGQASLIEAQGKVAGYVLVTFCFSVEFTGRFALIDELYLDPVFRGQGIGGHVLRKLEANLKSAGIGAMRLEVERSNLSAQNLYRRHGFDPHDRHLMTKWLV